MLGSWISTGMKLLPYISSAVEWVERFVRRKGRAKQDAAVQMILSMLTVAESAKEKDLLDDQAVEEATRRVIDAVVALQNVIASKQSS